MLWNVSWTRATTLVEEAGSFELLYLDMEVADYRVDHGEV